MKTISVHDFKDIVRTHTSDNTVDFINVCTPAEYKEKHIDGVRNVPLDTLKERAAEFANKQTIYVHCRSGRRSEQAIHTLEELGVAAELVSVSGGLQAWDEAQLPTKSLTNRLPIMRQVLLAAGVLVLLGLGLAWLVHPYFIGVTAFVGLGLSFAGLTGWCGMSYFLAKMPWNK